MKIIIIDDECLVLEGLKLLINRYDSSINIKCFHDVDAALQYVKIKKPDIIISDVQMPKMNGLKLCHELKELCAAEIIIISGFENFTYAKEAVELGALSYVLKPINQNEFIDALKIAINKIEKNKSLNMAYAKRNRIAKSKVLSDIANGFNTATLIKDELSELYDTQVYDCYCISIIVLDGAYFIPSLQHNEDFEITYNKLYKIINSTIETNHLTVFFSEAQPGKFIFLCMESWTKCNAFINRVAKQLKDRLDIGTTIGLSKTYKDIRDIFSAYDEALLAVQREFWVETNSIDTYNKELMCKIAPNLHNNEYTFNLKKLNYYQNLFCSIMVGENNNAPLNKAVDLLFDDLKLICNNSKEACRFCEELLLLIISNFFKTFEHTSLTSDDIIKFCNTIRFKDSKIVLDLKNSFIISLKNLTLIVQNKISHKSDTIKMIVDKLLSEDCSYITLQSAADAAGLNPTYFSILFKQKTGKNFKDYVLAYKMELAKQMLLNPAIKIYEISEKIGYPDSNYFSKVYKKYMGITPSEYRNTIR